MSEPYSGLLQQQRAKRTAGSLMDPCTGLVSLTAKGIPPVKASAPSPPPQWPPSRVAKSARARVRGPPREERTAKAAPLSARGLMPALPKPQAQLDAITKVASAAGPILRAGGPPLYARRFGWSKDEHRQWVMRQRQKLWQGEKRLGHGNERPRAGIVLREDSSTSVRSDLFRRDCLEEGGNARWCRKAGRWVQDATREDAEFRDAAERNGMAPAIAAASRAPGVAVSTLRGGMHATELSETSEGMTVPSMNDGLDDGNGAWWDPQDEHTRKGDALPPLKPAPPYDVSAVAIRKLASPRALARRHEPLSLAGKHSHEFYGVEVLEHLDTVRKHVSPPLQGTSAHL